MKQIFNLLKISREERFPALFAGLVIALLNALVIIKYHDPFFNIGNDYWHQFVGVFRVSGYDPITYVVLSDWRTGYSVYRHPLLAFFMWPFYLLNQLLMYITGINCAVFIASALLVLCAVYTSVFSYRLFRNVIDVSRFDSLILSFLYLSLAYVLVCLISPDHFALSMLLLTLVLYLAGKRIKNKQTFSILHTVLLFIVTGGVSLNNGVKVFLAALFTNGKRFFNIKYLLLAVFIPATLMWVGAEVIHDKMVYPGEVAKRHLRLKHQAEKKREMFKIYRDTVKTTDSAQIAEGFRSVYIQYLRKERAARHRRQIEHTGVPGGKDRFVNWTDVSTPRFASVVHNLLGESILLHHSYLLDDVLVERPIIVQYNHYVFYVVEAVIFVFFIIGIWCGRRSRLLWTVLSFFGFDMFIHLVLGFGLNEIYIMSPHWLIVFPISMAYVLRNSGHRMLVVNRSIISFVILFLFVYNIRLLISYLI